MSILICAKHQEIVYRRVFTNISLAPRVREIFIVSRLLPMVLPSRIFCRIDEALCDYVDSHRVSRGMTYDSRISWNTESKIGTRRFKPRTNGGDMELPGIHKSTTDTKIVLCAFAINFLRSEYFAHSVKSSYSSLIYLLFNLYKL